VFTIGFRHRKRDKSAAHKAGRENGCDSNVNALECTTLQGTTIPFHASLLGVPSVPGEGTGMPEIMPRTLRSSRESAMSLGVKSRSGLLPMI
jgi:hypothetical protein